MLLPRRPFDGLHHCRHYPNLSQHSMLHEVGVRLQKRWCILGMHPTPIERPLVQVQVLLPPLILWGAIHWARCSQNLVPAVLHQNYCTSRIRNGAFRAMAE